MKISCCSFTSFLTCSLLKAKVYKFCQKYKYKSQLYLEIIRFIFKQRCTKMDEDFRIEFN